MQKVVRKNKRSRKSAEDIIFMFLVYMFVIVALIACAYPLYFTIIASLSDPQAVYTGKVFLLPKGFTTKAYELVMENEEIWKGYANSIFYTVAGTCFNLFLTIPTAYALSKKRMFGRSLLSTVFIFTMYFSGGMIPSYILMKNLGMLDTRLILIISGGISVYNVIVTRTFYQNSIPEEVYEAARIDGASELSMFFKIAIPLSGPIIAVMALYYGVAHWGDYFTAMIYTQSEEIQPLQIILRRILILNQQLFEQMQEMDVSGELLQAAAQKAQLALTMKYAVVFIASAPMLIAYPFVQKHFVKGTMVGSLKG